MNLLISLSDIPEYFKKMVKDEIVSNGGVLDELSFFITEMEKVFGKKYTYLYNNIENYYKKYGVIPLPILIGRVPKTHIEHSNGKVNYITDNIMAVTCDKDFSLNYNKIILPKEFSAEASFCLFRGENHVIENGELKTIKIKKVLMDLSKSSLDYSELLEFYEHFDHVEKYKDYYIKNYDIIKEQELNLEYQIQVRWVEWITRVQFEAEKSLQKK